MVQYQPMGIIVLYNRVYECISTMYTNYTNNYDTSHVAYLEQLTTEEQQAEWAIFAALQPPQADFSDTHTHCQTSTPAALHTYPIKYIPTYIFPTSTSSPPSALASSSSPILPTPSSPILPPITPSSPNQPNISKDTQGQASTHDLL